MHTFIYRSPCNSYRTQIFQLQPGSPTTTTTSAQAIKNCILEKEVRESNFLLLFSVLTSFHSLSIRDFLPGPS